MRPSGNIQLASYGSAIAGAFSAINETFISNYGAFNVPPDTGDYGSPDFYTTACTDGKVQLASTATRISLKTASSYTLLGNSIFICTVPPMLAASDNDVEFIVNSSTAGTRLVIRINRNTPRITFSNEVSSAEAGAPFIPYSPTLMKFLRFRESGGSVFYETSADGSSWTTRRTISTPAWLTATANQSCQLTAHTATGFGLFEIESVNNIESLTDPLTTWHTALTNVGTAQARVVFVAPSDIEGNGATSRNTSILHNLVSRLVASYPVSGMGRCEYFPQHYFGPTWHQWDTSRSGTISEDDFNLGLGCRAAAMSTGAILTYTVVGTDVDIWTASGGACQISIDGGTYGSPFSASNAYGEITQFSLGATGTHTVSVKASTGPLQFLGMTVYDGGRSKGIVLYDYARSGAAVLTFYDPTGVIHSFANPFPRYITLIDPHLVIIKLQGNDAGIRTAAQYEGDLRAMRNAIETAAPSASILFMSAAAEDPSGPDDDFGGILPSPWHEYFDAMKTVALEHGQKLARITPPMPKATNAPGYYVDNNHYTDLGHSWVADFVQYHIDPKYAPLPVMGLTGTLPGGTNGVPYSATLAVTGYYVEGVTPGLQTGSLPGWMTATYNAGAGTITYAGTPTTGTTAFTPKATDSTSGTPQVAIGSAQSVVISAGAAFATFDPSRKGTGTTLTGSNLIATISGLYMACGTNPVDISTAQGYYAEFVIDATLYPTGFIGFGITKSTALTDQYLGAYANQACIWQDHTWDTGGGVTITNPLPVYQGLSPVPVVKIYARNNKVWIGVVGRGWWRPTSSAFDNAFDPNGGTDFCLSGFPAGVYSIGVSSISTAKATADFGATTFADTPPSGALGWPG